MNQPMPITIEETQRMLGERDMTAEILGRELRQSRQTIGDLMAKIGVLENPPAGPDTAGQPAKVGVFDEDLQEWI